MADESTEDHLEHKNPCLTRQVSKLKKLGTWQSTWCSVMYVVFMG